MHADKSIRIPGEILHTLLVQNPEKATALIASGTMDDAGRLVTKVKHLHDFHSIARPKFSDSGLPISDEPTLTFSF